MDRKQHALFGTARGGGGGGGGGHPGRLFLVGGRAGSASGTTKVIEIL